MGQKHTGTHMYILWIRLHQESKVGELPAYYNSMCTMDDYFFTTHGREIKILIFTKGVRGHLFGMRFAAKRRAVVLSNNTH